MAGVGSYQKNSGHEPVRRPLDEIAKKNSSSSSLFSLFSAVVVELNDFKPLLLLLFRNGCDDFRVLVSTEFVCLGMIRLGFTESRLS